MGLLQMSLSGAVMIIAIIVIRALAINHLPKKTFFDLVGNCAAEAYGAIFNPVSAECLFIGGAK